MTKSLWAKESSNIIKAAIKRSGLNYGQLVERLEQVGAVETVPSIKNKLARGTFSFIFVLQIMKALDRGRLDVE